MRVHLKVPTSSFLEIYSALYDSGYFMTINIAVFYNELGNISGDKNICPFA
jgi:hypothetical protein